MMTGNRFTGRAWVQVKSPGDGGPRADTIFGPGRERPPNISRREDTAVALLTIRN